MLHVAVSCLLVLRHEPEERGHLEAIWLLLMSLPQL